MGDLFSNLVFSKDDVITFPAGIPGFEDIREFALVHLDEYAPFDWLISTDKSNLRFAIINPMLFKPDYSPNIIKEQLDNLEIEKPEDILLYTLVTIKEDPRESTANLIGPVIINKTKRIGKQIIIDDEKYSTKVKIISET